MFYGEEWLINEEKEWNFENGVKPLGCLVWSGKGEINGTKIDATDEFLITPKAKVSVVAEKLLCIYVFFPIPQ